MSAGIIFQENATDLMIDFTSATSSGVRATPLNMELALSAIILIDASFVTAISETQMHSVMNINSE